MISFISKVTVRLSHPTFAVALLETVTYEARAARSLNLARYYRVRRLCKLRACSRIRSPRRSQVREAGGIPDRSLFVGDSARQSANAGKDRARQGPVFCPSPFRSSHYFFLPLSHPR